MGYFLDRLGSYYEGDRAHALDLQVPQRPSERYVWIDGAWALDPTWLDRRAALAIDGVDRLQFEHLFDLENRLRALEGLPTVTRAQYRQALMNRWKLLNP
jgi:hypothetical protein